MNDGIVTVYKHFDLAKRQNSLVTFPNWRTVSSPSKSYGTISFQIPIIQLRCTSAARPIQQCTARSIIAGKHVYVQAQARPILCRSPGRKIMSIYHCSHKKLATVSIADWLRPPRGRYRQSKMGQKIDFSGIIKISRKTITVEEE